MSGTTHSKSGGLGTPAHLRVESGAIHKANKGVLFIDEVSNLDPRSQQELLTALQEKKYSITGQSDMSSGALVKTEPVPSDFILVAAGNLQDLQRMHPALRSRIRGYGYEVYMESTMEDNATNRELLVQFIAQEIKKDGKIPAIRPERDRRDNRGGEKKGRKEEKAYIDTKGPRRPDKGGWGHSGRKEQEDSDKDEVIAAKTLQHR